MQGHVISTGTASQLHGWHLSRSPHAFLARLIVPLPFSRSELGLRATAHIRPYLLPTMEQPLPLVPDMLPTTVAERPNICCEAARRPGKKGTCPWGPTGLVSARRGTKTRRIARAQAPRCYSGQNLCWVVDCGLDIKQPARIKKNATNSVSE
jgi:hypothetical protein